MDKINSVAITKIEKLYQAAMNDRDSVRSFVGSEMLEDIYREQYFRAYRITHDVAQFAWETRQYRKFLRTHQQAAAPPLLPAQDNPYSLNTFAVGNDKTGPQPTND